jgi:hypothetical protein
MSVMLNETYAEVDHEFIQRSLVDVVGILDVCQDIFDAAKVDSLVGREFGVENAPAIRHSCLCLLVTVTLFFSLGPSDSLAE